MGDDLPSINSEQTEIEKPMEPIDSTVQQGESKIPIQQNFWLEGNYKKVTRRIEDGARAVDDLSKLIQERAEIENLYATKLKAWQKKWLESFDRTNEYGSLLGAIQSTLHEAELLCDLHQSIHGKLVALSMDVQQWKSQRYLKSLTKYKESRRSEEAFSKAQGPWVVKCKEVTKCMKSYHSSCHALDVLNEQLVALKNDTSETSQEQINKINTKLKKSELEVENWKNKYNDSIRDVKTYNSKYVEDMNYEFNNCQVFERTRRDFVTERLGLFITYIDRCIFIENYKEMYATLSTSQSNIDIEEDLRSYQKVNGPDHPMQTTEFVEYDASQFQANKSEPTVPKNNTKKSGVCTTL